MELGGDRADFDSRRAVQQQIYEMNPVVQPTFRAAPETLGGRLYTRIYICSSESESVSESESGRVRVRVCGREQASTDTRRKSTRAQKIASENASKSERVRPRPLYYDVCCMQSVPFRMRCYRIALYRGCVLNGWIYSCDIHAYIKNVAYAYTTVFIQIRAAGT